MNGSSVEMKELLHTTSRLEAAPTIWLIYVGAASSRDL
jgi:hypothetical protein